ncbi:MAG: hypothetical protein IV108_07815 [Burkholderiales bacterium]|nr:hypothetical protein [Burkholderiales bacterium]
MHILKHLRVLVTLIVLLTSLHAAASQEGAMVWSEFAISSPGIGSSGPIKISGTQNHDGISTLKVSAFGREHVATASQLQGLRKFSANGMLISYEAGYRELGGRTLYLTFVQGFLSGVQDKKVVTFNEAGEIKVRKEAAK